MIKLFIFLLLLGSIITGLGIRLSDQGARKLGLGLLIAAFVVLLFQSLSIKLLP